MNIIVTVVSTAFWGLVLVLIGTGACPEAVVDVIRQLVGL